MPCYLQEDQTRGGQQRGRLPRCIVLAPTRELAQQVEREFNGAAPTLSCGVFYGGACRASLALPFFLILLPSNVTSCSCWPPRQRTANCAVV